ncbi:MAG: COX15/CtaA family protein [Proteobacteria bacterium]|nr:COX15/CtaA family protein [Pseudomonadota bacterium]
MEQTRNDRQIAMWLIFCSAVVLGMIILGGVTRLTHSGLSMVEWRPLVGIIPPTSEAEWVRVFEKYQQFPEYQKKNLGMDLQGFKSIFMYEYLHRVLGRLIGIFFFVPFVFFALKGRIKSGLMPKLVVMFFLGGLQGLLGWYMVKSGLVNDPHVSQYRLTAHLGAAVLIYGYMLWVAFDLLFPGAGERSELVAKYARWSLVLVALIYLMILSGGLVAGTRAGFAYSTWPLMGNSFVPDGLYSGWLSVFEDITTIQFNHRMFAYLLLALISSFSWLVYQARVSTQATTAVMVLMLALLVQVVLGISTLLLHVPVPVAVAHQGGAIVTFTAMLFASHSLVRP